MSFSRHTSRAARFAQPVSAYLELTYRCNWRCGFCYNPRRNDVRPLDLSEWTKVLDELRVLGTLTVTLTGGEPMRHPAFFEIADAVRDRSFALRIFTNGSLIDETAAERIAALDPIGVEMSLHGATATTHDNATGARGSFDALMRGIDAVMKNGIPLTLKTPLTSLNESEIDEMMELARTLSVPYRIDPRLTARDDGDQTPLAFAASPEAVRRVAALAVHSGTAVPMSREANAANCGLGRTTIAIDPEGNVFPCMQWRQSSIGNVRSLSLSNVWQASEVRVEAASVATEAHRRLLELGDSARMVAFCPALAFQATGNPYAVPEELRSYSDALEQAQRELEAPR
jgi:MoaA/NifB/PqqE/SkfB family radical SAM enzyme